MIVRWPDQLPLPTLAGYAIQPGEAILRTEMEAGPARQRRRFTNAPSRIAVRWVMRAEQFALFEAWYRWAAAEGGAWFEIDLLGGLGLAPQEARFTRQFEARLYRRRLWEVTSELEVRARPTLSEAGMAILLTEEVTGLIASVDGLHDLVHQTLPGTHTGRDDHDH